MRVAEDGHGISWNEQLDAGRGLAFHTCDKGAETLGANRGTTFQALLDVAEGMLKRGDSVPFAGRLGFPHPVSVGMPVFVTDASGFEGFGGWTVRGDHLVFCAALWPEPVLAALRDGMLSVSAAELFTQAAVAAAIGRMGQWGVFIGDSSAACNAVAKDSSSTPQMSEMLNILLAVAPGTTWLSVHVRREHNTVADDLSKLKLGEVVRFALSKGLVPEERPVPSWVVKALLDHLHVAGA